MCFKGFVVPSQRSRRAEPGSDTVLLPALRLFVNMRQKHVTPLTFFGGPSNQEAGVCARGRGLSVLLR